MDANRRKAILIVGMHRSGTSVLARVVNLLGANLGQSFIPPKEDNVRGFWENREILGLHEEFLANISCRWHDPILLPATWRRDEPAGQFQEALRQLLEKQFDNHALIAVKDPRLSILAPLWLPVLADLSIEPLFLVSIRHPVAVAASLARRDGFSPSHSHLMWLQHMMEASCTSGRGRHIFVHFETFLNDWRAMVSQMSDRLGLEWPVDLHEVEAQIDAFVDPSLRHHQFLDGDSTASLPDLVQQLYQWLCASANGREDPAELSDIQTTGNSILQIGGIRCLELARTSNRRHELLQQEISRARQVIEQKHKELDNARGTINSLAEQLKQARERHDALLQEIDQARSIIAAKDEEIHRAGHVVDDLQRQIDQARIAHLARDAAEKTLRQKINLMRQSLFYHLGLRKENEMLELAERHHQSLEDELARANDLIDVLASDLDAARTRIDMLDETNNSAQTLRRSRDENEDDKLRAEIQRLHCVVGEYGTSNEPTSQTCTDKQSRMPNDE